MVPIAAAAGPKTGAERGEGAVSRGERGDTAPDALRVWVCPAGVEAGRSACQALSSGWTPPISIRRGLASATTGMVTTRTPLA